MDNQNNTTPNSAPQNTGVQGGAPLSPPPLGSNEGPENKSSVGPIIGSVIVVLVIVLGGLYLYGERLSDKINQEVPIEDVSTESDQATNDLKQQGSTDDLAEINADLASSDFNGLDAESVAIEQELSVE